MGASVSAPSLFDVAAEQEAIATGKPLSQTRLEIEHPAPAPLPADSLFAPRRGARITPQIGRGYCPDCGHRLDGRDGGNHAAARIVQMCERCGAAFKARERVPAVCNLCRRAQQ